MSKNTTRNTINTSQKITSQTSKKRINLVAKKDEQSALIRAILDNKITFACGSPGTGKSHIATVLGLQEIINHKNYSKMILTRPCVEAFGEKLGFLPGDYNDKIEPYMMPIFNIVKDHLSAEFFTTLLSHEVIETIPIAFMRGVSFVNAFVVIDEAQNTTTEQMRLVLTRLGEGSKIIVTGDPNQVDRGNKDNNGFVDAINRFKGVKDIAVVHMSEDAIVRDPLVKIIDRKYGLD